MHKAPAVVAELRRYSPHRLTRQAHLAASPKGQGRFLPMTSGASPYVANAMVP
jgi:hypothetical protein